MGDTLKKALFSLELNHSLSQRHFKRRMRSDARATMSNPFVCVRQQAYSDRKHLIVGEAEKRQRGCVTNILHILKNIIYFLTDCR